MSPIYKHKRPVHSGNCRLAPKLASRSLQQQLARQWHWVQLYTSLLIFSRLLQRQCNCNKATFAKGFVFTKMALLKITQSINLLFHACFISSETKIRPISKIKNSPCTKSTDLKTKLTENSIPIRVRGDGY